MMDDGRTPYLFRQLFYPLRWLIYVFNSVVNTKLPAILSHRCSITVSLETYPFYSKVINVFADLNTWAPNAKKETVGKKAFLIR